MKKKNMFWIFPISILASIFLLTTGCEKKSTDNPNNVDTTHTDTSNLIIPAGWSKVGDLKANNMIWSVTSDVSGNIYAAGYFTNTAGYFTNTAGYHYVAKWNGTVWADIGINANSSIYALTTDVSGNVYAVGEFTNGATPAGGDQYVAKWNGSSWNDIGQSHSGLLLAADVNGNVYNGPSKWNGSTWTQFAAMYPEVYGTIQALATTSSGDFQYAGGSFAHANGYRYVVKWNGSIWTEIGSLNANANIEALAVDNQGNVYAAGNFTNGNLPTTGHYYVAKWNGTSWSELGNLNANGDIYYLAVDNVHGYVYASGYFRNAAGKAYVAKWDGTSWSDLGDMALSPTPIHVDASGKLYSVVSATNGKNFCVVVHN